MKDRAMQALYLLALEPIAETTADRNSYGFRPGAPRPTPLSSASWHSVARHSAEWVLEGDIRGCFDNISHEWMLRHIPTDKVILRKWLKAGFVENRILFPTEAGTPQGGIISPALANLTLDGLEQLLKEHFRVKNQWAAASSQGEPRAICGRLHHYRHDQGTAGKRSQATGRAVSARPGLALSPEKTCVTHIEQGFDFLGQNVRKYDGKLLIRPSKKNMHAFLEKVRAVIRGTSGTARRS